MRGLTRLAGAVALALVAIPALAAPAHADAGASGCRPSAAHPRPVVLVHGTFLNSVDDWVVAAPLLRQTGYCVFAIDYGQGAVPGVNGVAPIEGSARQLSDFVDGVLAATGASQVDIVGHSQGGGVLPRYYLKFLGGAAKVHSLIGLAPSNHGTTVDGVITLADALGLRGLVDAGFDVTCPACTEQFVGSDLLARVNNGGDTMPGVQYTVIETRFDEVVTPFTSAFLSGRDVTNITLQDACPLDLVDHVGITSDPAALRYVRNALDPTTARPPVCLG